MRNKSNKSIYNLERVIYTTRGMQVMIDSEIALLSDVETGILNQAEKKISIDSPKSLCFKCILQNGKT